MKSPKVFAAASLALALPAFGAAEEWESPRYQLAFSGGGSIFRGGQPGSSLSSVVPFQPDVTSVTGAGTFALRLTSHVALEAEFASARGRTKDGAKTPNNNFVSGGVRIPWPLAGGRLVPSLAFGGGIVSRRVQDGFQQTVESAFEVRRTDPQAYAGVGVEYRLTRRFGVRGDYRYVRIFPKDVQGLAARQPYGPHRFTGGLTLSY